MEEGPENGSEDSDCPLGRQVRRDRTDMAQWHYFTNGYWLTWCPDPLFILFSAVNTSV